MGKKKTYIWPKANKCPEEPSYINDITTASLLSSSSLRGTPTPFLSTWVSLPCLCLKQASCFSVWSPICAVSLIINFVPDLTVLYPWEMHCSVVAKARGILFLAPSPWCTVARIPSFYPGYPGPVPLQGTKISLQGPAHCCLSEITTC